MLLYLLSADTAKANKVEEMLEAGGAIRMQVLNQLVSVCHKKFKLNWQEIEALLAAVKNCFVVHPLTETSYNMAVRLSQRYSLSFYDAHICAYAILTNATQLFSVDMQDGLIIDGMLIKNPFK